MHRLMWVYAGRICKCPNPANTQRRRNVAATSNTQRCRNVVTTSLQRQTRNVKHATSHQRRYNVAATSRRWSDVVTTLLRRCVFAGKELFLTLRLKYDLLSKWWKPLICLLTFITFRANSAEDHLIIIFLFLQKIWYDMSSKLST